MSLYNFDLFISYAHIDNQPLSDEKSGWISRFHSALHTLLSMRLGKEVRIWRDDKLQGNDRFAEEIVDQFERTAVLISVLTPRYLSSEWCTREVNEFCSRSSEQLFVEQKARIFKVIKSPVDSQTTLPSVMQELLGYDFYVFEDGVPMELDDAYGQQYGQDFNRKVNKLAFEVADLLKRLDKPADTVQTVENKPTVYLAECTYDVKHAREIIETQLTCLGYKVLPDRQLPIDEKEYIDAVDKMLARCDVSVHFIGGQYGAVPHGPNDSSTAFIQNQLAAQHAHNTPLRRLIWLQEGLLTDDHKQQKFIQDLHSDADVQHGADLLTGDVESLKTALQGLLDKAENAVPQLPPNNLRSTTEAQESSLYLICTEYDRKATVPLRKYLREHGVNVSMPAFKGNAAEVRTINQQLLAGSDIVMVYYGEGEEAWKRSIDTELRKLPVYLDGKSSPDILTYLAAPTTCDKEDLIDMSDGGVIDGTDALAKSMLDELFESVGTTVELP